jgi:hypothetical protein
MFRTNKLKKLFMYSQVNQKLPLLQVFFPEDGGSGFLINVGNDVAN